MVTSRVERAIGVVLGCLVFGAHGWAQPAPPAAAPPGTVSIEADPIRCWWRTSTGAVRVAEPFSLVLTCAVIENGSTKVVPDEGTLDPVAMQLPPFEVLGGTHAPDLRRDERRFFQYQYTLRLVSDSMFEKDVVLSGLQIPYRVQTKVDAASIEGRNYTYILPDISVRLLSLVPENASDIRDATSETFADIDARAFRPNVLLVVSGTLFAFGALMLLLGLVRFGRRREGLRVAPGLLSDRAILGKVARELSVVRRERELQGWTSELAGRALAACRVAGGYGLGQRVSQVPAVAGGNGSEGQLVLRGGWLWGKQVTVSGWVTPESVAQELARLSAAVSASGSNGNGEQVQRLEALQAALANLTAARYGREEALNSDVLDESLAAGASLTRRLKFEHAWLVMRISSLAESSARFGRRVWLR